VLGSEVPGRIELPFRDAPELRTKIRNSQSLMY